MGSSGSLFRYEPATGLSEVYEYKDLVQIVLMLMIMLLYGI